MSPQARPFLAQTNAAVTLLRPGNAGLAYAAVLVGGVLTGGPAALALLKVHLAALAVVLVASGANADNDRLDVAADALNRPNRPLPQGTLPVRVALGLWLGCTGAGLLVAGLVSPWHFGVAGGAALVLAGYSRWWKGWPLVGNVVVAGLLALALVFGGAAGGEGPGALVGAVFAFLTNLARELVKDAEDVVGDQAAGRRTFAVRAGASAAVRLGQGIALMTLLLLPMPYLMLSFGGLYLVAALTCGLALAYVLGCPPTDAGARRASAWLKVAMVGGVVALALGRVAP